jgi:hypothetical protein
MRNARYALGRLSGNIADRNHEKWITSGANGIKRVFCIRLMELDHECSHGDLGRQMVRPLFEGSFSVRDLTILREEGEFSTLILEWSVMSGKTTNRLTSWARPT